MVCSQVRDQLLTPDGALPAEALAHLHACAPCQRLQQSLARLDAALGMEVTRPPLAALPIAFEPRIEAALQAALVVAPPVVLQASLAALPAMDAPARVEAALQAALVVEPSAALSASLAALPEMEASARVETALKAALIPQPPVALQASLAAAARTEAALQAALVVEPPAALQASLAALPGMEAAARVETAVRAAVVVEAPAPLQARLAALAPANDALGWLPGVWQQLRARPAVFAGQLAALAVLAYAVVQVAAWLGTLPVVVGDVPYALELLLLSPAVDVLSQFEGIVQQLGLWLLVAGAGWLLAQSVRWRQREPAS